MQKKLTKDDVEFKICGDFYTLLQKYYEPEETDEFWANFSDESIKFSKKYNNILADEMALLLYRILRKKRELKIKKK